MLDQVAMVLPQGGNGWTKVASLFNAEEATLVARDAESIKRKFIALKNNKKPTGDPECPPEVVRAKRIQREIDNKASVVTLDDQDDNECEADGHDSGAGFVDEEANFSDDIPPSETGSDARLPDLVPHSLPAQSPPVVPRPRAGTPRSQHSSEKENRVGLSQANLAAMGRVLSGTQGGTPANNSAGTMSYVAKRRQKLDRFIDRFDDAEKSSANISSDMMAIMLMMDERAAARQADREERERQFQLEQARREEDREERRAERDARHMQMQMMMMAKLFGGHSSDNQSSQ